MPSLSPAIVPLLSPFAPLFDTRTWRKVQILLTEVILAPGRRTVSTALYVPGLQARGDFALFHHVLSRASWSSLAVSRVLLDQLVRHLVPTGPLRLAIDETLERCWGEQIEALGMYRDPVRSSHGHFVKAKGLRWVSLMLRAEVSWARWVWALPFLTVRAGPRPGVTTRPGAAATRRLRTGPDRGCASCAGRVPSAPARSPSMPSPHLRRCPGRRPPPPPGCKPCLLPCPRPLPTSTFQVAVNGARVSWNATSSPGYFSNDQNAPDPKIDIYDRDCWWGDYARMVYLCGVNSIFLGNEVDIKFNTDTMSGLSASDKSKVAMHEMGHAYGLDHVNSGCVVMRKYLSQFKNCSPLPASGDVDGVNHLC